MTKYIKRSAMQHLLLALLASVSSIASAAQFAIKDATGIHVVQPAYVDKFLRDIPTDKFMEASEHIAVRAVKLDNGEYALHAHVRGLGGGPLLGQIGMWGTRAVGYGAFAALCIVQPHALLEAHLAAEAIEMAANAAFIVGTLAPTA